MADQSLPVTGNPLRSAAVYHYVAPQNKDTYTSQQRATFITPLVAIPICILITGINVTRIILRPQFPQIRLETLNLSNFNTSPNSLISGDLDARFIVRNTISKTTIYYDEIAAAVFYKSHPISATSVPPFVQVTGNETAIRATFAPLMTFVDDWYSVSGDRSHGTVNFNLIVVARFRLSDGWWASRRFWKVYCPDLSIGVSSNSNGGTVFGGSKQCSVGGCDCVVTNDFREFLRDVCKDVM